MRHRLLDRREVVVLGDCRHWWIEHQPAGLLVDTTAPRVCTSCEPDSPGSVGPSPQGFGMVLVTYLLDWTEEPR